MTPEVARRPLIAGNWKLWGTKAQAAEYCQQLASLLPGDDARNAAIGICPVYTALEVCVNAFEGTGVAVYAQNMHQASTGAFTGEVSAEMLTELGVDGVVLGHSERREYNCETDRALQEKVPAALAAGLEPILCVGESEEERERDETQRKLRSQVQEALEKVSDERLSDVVIAYEPIWAIGTGKVATPEIAQDAIAFIRALVGDRSPDAAGRCGSSTAAASSPTTPPRSSRSRTWTARSWAARASIPRGSPASWPPRARDLPARLPRGPGRLGAGRAGPRQRDLAGRHPGVRRALGEASAHRPSRPTARPWGFRRGRWGTPRSAISTSGRGRW